MSAACCLSSAQENTRISESTWSVNLEIVPISRAQYTRILPVNVLLVLGCRVDHFVAREVVHTIPFTPIHSLNVLGHIRGRVTHGRYRRVPGGDLPRENLRLRKLAYLFLLGVLDFLDAERRHLRRLLYLHVLHVLLLFL